MMRLRPFLLACAAAALVLFSAVIAGGARQVVALFPLENLADNTIGAELPRLGQLISDKLKDRLDIQMIGDAAAGDPYARKRKARSVGATYVLTGSVSRIGRTLTLDLNLAAIDEPSKGRTVVVTGVDEGSRTGKALPPIYSRMATEATAKLKLLFFGNDIVGEGFSRRKIQHLSGTVSRSRNIPGEVVSVAWNDTDRDGRKEVIAAYTEGIVVYRVEGDELQEKVRIDDAGTGIMHVDVADLNRKGIADIIAVKFVTGKALSDVWEFDGSAYRRIARDIPYFLRVADMGKEGIVLFAQESDPVSIFKGPVFRFSLSKNGPGERRENGLPLPLPEGTWIYSFIPLKKGESLRYVAIGERDRLLLLDEKGTKLWESLDAVSGTETALDPVENPSPRSGKPGGGKRRVYLPNRLFAVDLQSDHDDKLIVLNNLVTRGGFFENLRIYSNAEALCFVQDGDALQLAWRTTQAGSSARDSFIDLNPSNHSLRIGLVTRDKGKILGKFGEWRILWMK